MNIEYHNRIPLDDMPAAVVGDNWGYPWHHVKTYPGRLGFRPAGDGIKAMKQWCSEHTRHRWSSYISEFFFEDQADAMWFTMRWS